MLTTQHSLQQVNQARQLAQQLINQTQQGNQQYRMMLQQEQQNIQILEQILQREKQAVQVLEQSLQNHHVAINRCQEIINVCNQIQQDVSGSIGVQSVQGTPVYQQRGYSQNQSSFQPQYSSQFPLHQ